MAKIFGKTNALRRDDPVEMGSSWTQPDDLAPLPGFAENGVAALIEAEGNVGLERAVSVFGMTKGQLAETAGLSPDTARRVARSYAPKSQRRMTEMLEIVSRVTAWAGGEKQAMAWYRATPIPAFGDRTAESLVKDGRAGAVRDYLDHLAMGGFA